MKFELRVKPWQWAIAVSLFLNPLILQADPSLSPTDESGASESDAPADSGPIVADGQPIAIEKLGVTVQPPMGWSLRLGYGNGPSVVMEEPKAERTKDDVGKTFYQSNITVALLPKSAPMDESRAEELSTSLQETFSKNPSVANYQVTESTVFNLNEDIKGIRAFAYFQLNGVDMMHMHVLVPGEEKQFLLTYTDLTSRFSVEDPRFQMIWASMVSISGLAKAPGRYDDIALAGGIGFLILMMLSGVTYIARRGRKIDFDQFEQEAAINDDVEIDDENSSNYSFDSSMNDDLDDWDLDHYGASADDEEMVSSIQKTAIKKDFKPTQLASRLRKPKAYEIEGEFADHEDQVVSHQEFESRQRAKKEKPLVAAKIKVSSNEEDAWVLPVKTRISPERFSHHG